MGRLAKVMSKSAQPGLKSYKSGGAIKHDDVAEDKKLIASELKKKGLKKGGCCK